jgi:hypothetical protein
LLASLAAATILNAPQLNAGLMRGFIQQRRLQLTMDRRPHDRFAERTNYELA